MDVEGGEAGRPALHQIAADLAIVALGPHHRHLRHRAIGDPQLGAVQHVLVALLDGARGHGAGVGAVIGLGKSEAAEGLAGLEPRQPLLLLRLRAVGVDRVHDEPALHGGEGAQARVAALQFLHDEPVGDVVEARAAVTGEGGPEHAHLAEGLGHLEGEGAVAMVLAHHGHELLLHPVADGIPHHPLFLAQQGLDPVVVDAAIVAHRCFLPPAVRRLEVGRVRGTLFAERPIERLGQELVVLVRLGEDTALRHLAG